MTATPKPQAKPRTDSGKVPRATYRLQFHRGFTLRQARELIDYLSGLGVSHIYASPLLLARPGSCHGYDTCDPTRINPEIGTEADLEELAAALRQKGMGLVLDIVPNHMGIGGPENRWWWDVLMHGRHSPFAGYFDIDWDSPDPDLRGKVLMPILGDDYARVLERGELQVRCEAAEVTVTYYDHRLPVDPDSLLSSGALLDETLARLNAHHRELDQFLQQQHYRLAYWRQGDTRLNYRRFFTITSLAGVRVEVPQVFADSHRRILDWIQRGLLDGLRVDHPDGLRDPQGYLRRLAEAAPGTWVTVEKILMPGEELPRNWPVAGTTGYDFLNEIAGLSVNRGGEVPLTEFYRQFTKELNPFPAILRDKKRLLLEKELAAEITQLERIVSQLQGAGPETAGRPSRWRDALIELAACFPVYRTYRNADTPRPGKHDRAVIEEAVGAAQKGRPNLLAELNTLRRLLLLGHVEGMTGEFILRFQQLTGPAMAKGAEDTAFYCYNRLLALNEVGGDPGRFGTTPEEFHDWCRRMHRQHPHTMLATSTHDTKRSEDVRARLAVLSEMPQAWTDAIRRWSVMNERYRQDGWPDRNAEYAFYQVLAGAWPLSLDRALAYMEKAAREAKQHTTWTDPNPAYEQALRLFVTGVLNSGEFLEDLEPFAQKLARAGALNSLAWLVLKLTAPGVPDIYQGTELWDLSLVDPDNRRPVDYDLRVRVLAELGRRVDQGDESLPGELARTLADGRIKLFILRQTLAFRKQHEHVFRQGRYLPLTATGVRAGNLVAFSRSQSRMHCIVVVPRLVLDLLDTEADTGNPSWSWADTRLVLPEAFAGKVFQNVFTRARLAPSPGPGGPYLELAQLLADFPVALLRVAGRTI